MNKQKRPKPSQLPVKVPSKAVKKAETVIPEELETIWDDDIAAAFAKMNEKQQNFLTSYLRTGDPAQSYRTGYNRPMASPHLAANSAYQILESIGIQAVMQKIQAQRTGDLFLVVKTFREMAEASKPEWTEDKNGQWQNVGDVPDWKARKDAADGLAKLRGLNAPAEVKQSLDITSRVIQVELPTKTK